MGGPFSLGGRPVVAGTHLMAQGPRQAGGRCGGRRLRGSPRQDLRHRHLQRLAAGAHDPPTRGLEGHDAPGGEVQEATVAALTGNRSSASGDDGSPSLIWSIWTSMRARNASRGRNASTSRAQKKLPAAPRRTPWANPPPLRTPLNASTKSARPKPLWAACGLPSGASDPPSKNASGSVVGLPA